MSNPHVERDLTWLVEPRGADAAWRQSWADRVRRVLQREQARREEAERLLELALKTGLAECTAARSAP